MNKRKKLPLPHFVLLVSLALIASGCATKPDAPHKEKEQVSSIKLLFAGDIMAHKPNYSMKDFHKIWLSVKDQIRSADLSFGNIESPVDDTRDFSTFPNFNFKHSFADAIIDAGFNVFSLVNNHTNDQELEGMMHTLDWAESIEHQSEQSQRKIFFSGLKRTPQEPFSYRLIEKNGFKILFLAVSEILNRPSYSKYMNFVRPTEKGWADFIQYVKELQKENPCDLFILSVHSDDPEYVHEVSTKRKNYFKRLLDAGVDIIWANHPHVVREHDLYMDAEGGFIKNVVMYGNGNTISAQRHLPQLSKPDTPRDDTGDGVMITIEVQKTKDLVPVIKSVKSSYITTYITPNYEFVIENLNDDFIKWLEENRPQWAPYIKARKEITEKTKENIIWQ